MLSDVSHDAIALVMAAGRGERFGADKRRHRLGDGRTLLETTLAAIAPAYRKIYVLVRPGETLASLEIEHIVNDKAPVECLEAPSAARGLGGTLGDAFRHLCERDEPAIAASVVLADMPWLEANLCRRLNAAARSERIVMPHHGSGGGHPVLFGRGFWAELATLTEGEGAREIVTRHRAACHWVPVDTPSIRRDVDRPEDLG
ncbi:nucleotidyltransferase family protein [Salinicola halophilus]|uniref:nucleotidyltransferase family protein n=1 Tax=Salinicola halophilus TaxID=184065 RepID=UPI000DA12840|nr:nucleotidyltransferase family protein [Salinicola halophilus]